MRNRLTIIPTAVPFDEAERLEDPETIVEDIVARSMEQERVRRYVRALPHFQNKVIRLRYGLDNDDPVTIRECAERLRCSPTHIHKTERRALETLRRQFESSPPPPSEVALEGGSTGGRPTP